MGDLISRSRLLDSMHREDTRLIGGNHYVRLSAAQEKIRVAPTIDAVPVVRCRECVHNEDEDVCPFVRVNCGEKWLEIIKPHPDGFCNLGEKMDGGAEG